MKKIFLTALVAGACLFSATANSLFGTVSPIEEPAKTSKQVALTYAGPQKIKLTVLDDSKGKVDIAIYDAKSDKLIESKTIKYEDSFSLPIDFSSIGAGQYIFEVKGGDISLEQDVFISEMSDEDVYACLTPTSSGKYQLKVYQDHTPVRVELTDTNGRVLYKDTYKGEANFTQVFDLTEVSEDQKLYLSITGTKSSLLKIIN